MWPTAVGKSQNQSFTWQYTQQPVVRPIGLHAFGSKDAMKKFNLGQTISILANVGVIIGLILVTVEIHQSNKQAASAAYRSRIAEVENSLRQFALSNDLPGIYVQLEESGLGSLNAEQLSRVVAWEWARQTRMEGQFHEYQDGYLDEKSYRAMLGAAQRYLALWDELGLNPSSEEFTQAVRNFNK